MPRFPEPTWWSNAVRAALPPAFTLLTLFGVIMATLLWTDFARERARRTLAADGGAMQAFLLVRPADCRSNLDLLRLLERAPVAGRIARGGVLLLGTEEEVRPVRAWMQRELPAVRVQRLTMLHRYHLAAAGWNGRAAVLVAGARGAPTLLVPVPVTAGQRAALRRSLDALAEFAGGGR